MTTGELSTVVMNDDRRNTVVNLKQVNEIPLRNVLETFDRNGDGKIDISELQKIVYWYGLWKYASIGLCMVIMLLVWSTFGLTIWAINLTKEYTVTDGVLTGGDEVVKMSVASTYIPLSWATLLDRRHLDALESLSIDVTQGSGKFSAGVYHVKVASYLHANSTYLKLFGEDGSRIWVNSGTVVLHHPDADEAIMVCGAAACNTLAVDVKPEYLQQLVQRSAVLFASARDFELPAAVDGVTISKAAGEEGTCRAASVMNLLCGAGSVDISKIGNGGFFKQLEACAEAGPVWNSQNGQPTSVYEAEVNSEFELRLRSTKVADAMFLLGQARNPNANLDIQVDDKSRKARDIAVLDGTVPTQPAEQAMAKFLGFNREWLNKNHAAVSGVRVNPTGTSSVVKSKSGGVVRKTIPTKKAPKKFNKFMKFGGNVEELNSFSWMNPTAVDAPMVGSAQQAAQAQHGPQNTHNLESALAETSI